MSLLTRFLVFIPWLAFCEVQAAAQAPSNSPGTPTDRGTWRAYDKLVTVLDGTVKDLSVRAGGDLIYCTEEGELGTIPSEGGGDPIVIAPVGTFIGKDLRALTSTPTTRQPASAMSIFREFLGEEGGKYLPCAVSAGNR